MQLVFEEICIGDFPGGSVDEKINTNLSVQALARSGHFQPRLADRAAGEGLQRREQWCDTTQDFGAARRGARQRITTRAHGVCPFGSETTVQSNSAHVALIASPLPLFGLGPACVRAGHSDRHSALAFVVSPTGFVPVWG